MAQRISWAERIARGVARGLTPSQAAGRPKPTERAASVVSGKPLRGAAKRSAAQRVQRELGRPLSTAVGPSRPIPWSSPTAGGTRDFYTGDRGLVRKALEDAQWRGRDVLLGVRSNSILHGPYQRSRRETDWAYTGRTSPGSILVYIKAEDGNVDAGVSRYLEVSTGTSAGEIIQFHVKEFRD